jgi:hypothetical protein
MGRLKTPTLAIVALLLFISLPSFLSDAGAGTNTPTINAKYTWSYHLQSTDGTTTKDGTMSATVSKVQWNGGPTYKFDGSLSGTFQTSAGSGTESGTWREYYGNLSLDHMDHMEVIDLVTGGNTVTNTTQVNYNPPLRWIKNRPPTTMDPWSQTDVKVLNTWSRKINGEDDMSGMNQTTLSFTWICPNTPTISVGAGTFFTYRIREFVQDDPKNQITDYYYNETIGWWVQKDVFVNDDEGIQVRIKHYELEEYSLNEAPVKVGSPQITMNEDATDRSVDLDSIFSDPDEDPLTFALVDDDIFTVIFEAGNKLSVTPPPNFFGKGNITVSGKDPFHAAITATIPVKVNSVDDPPILTGPTLSPSSGDESTLFTYSITSTDIDTFEPSSAEIRIDTSTFDLTKISGNNKTGILWQYSINLPPGTHTYSFLIDDIRYPSTGDLNGPSVTAREDPFLKDGGVNPTSGNVNTDFTFRVKWIGPNGEVPDTVELFLDGTGISLSGDTGDPEIGIVFSETRKLSEGGHSFHFEAAFGADQYRFPQSGNLNGPTVVGLADPYLTEGSVDPEDGGLSTDFTFEVTWIGPNGEVPNEILLVLDDLEMDLSKEGGTAKTGITYIETINLEEGEHSFHFKATLGSDTYRLPRSGDIDGPVVYAPEIGECGYVHIEDGSDTATYEFYANYKYVLNVDPEEAIVIINGQGYDLNQNTGSPVSGMNLTRRVSLPEGTYTVSMKIVAEGVTLTASCDNLKIVIEDVPGPNGNGDHGNDTGNSDKLSDAIPIIVAAIIIIAIIAVVIFLLMRRKKAQADVWADPENESEVNLPRDRFR